VCVLHLHAHAAASASARTGRESNIYTRLNEDYSCVPLHKQLEPYLLLFTVETLFSFQLVEYVMLVLELLVLPVRRPSVNLKPLMFSPYSGIKQTSKLALINEQVRVTLMCKCNSELT
jgi:hypothetical protein